MNTNNQPESNPDPVFPVALLPAGRDCLVVGAGKAGFRKAAALAEAGGRVTILAPEGNADTREWAARGRLTWLQRPFEADDPRGFFVAFAATNQIPVNQAVLQACRRHGVLCGIVDNGWREGDFISPAVLRHPDGLTISVSTGGRSCRLARMVRDSLGRHVEAVATAVPTVIGTGHACLTLEKRERISLVGDRLEAAAHLLRQVRGIHEFLLLNTCNRVECQAVLSPDPAALQLIRRILGFDALAPEESYLHLGYDAFRHTALLLAGLHSRLQGETHIIAQVRSALGRASESGWSGSLLEEWHASAHHVARTIRADSRPAPADLEDRVLDHLAETAPDFPAGGLLLIGAGELGRGLMDRFRRRFPGAPADWVYHRHAPELTGDGADRIRLHAGERLDDLLPRARALVCAAAAADPILTARHAARLPPAGPVAVVDLGVPRNVSACFRTARPNLTILALDDLKAPDEGGEQAGNPLEAARLIVDDHRDLYAKLVRGLP